MENNKFIINLEVAGRTYPVTIERGDEEREYYARQASKRVQEIILLYRQYFDKSIQERDLLAMVSIQLAMELIQMEDKNDTKPFTEKIQQLTNELEAYLKK